MPPLNYKQPRKFQTERNTEYYAEPSSVVANNTISEKSLNNGGKDIQPEIEGEKIIEVIRQQNGEVTANEQPITRRKLNLSEEQRKKAGDRLRAAALRKKEYVTQMRQIDPNYKYIKGHLKELDIEAFKKDFEQKKTKLQKQQDEYNKKVQEKIEKGELVKIRMAKKVKRTKNHEHIVLSSSSSEDDDKLVSEEESDSSLCDSLDKITNKEEDELTAIETDDIPTDVEVKTKRVTSKGNKKAVKEIKDIKQKIQKLNPNKTNTFAIDFYKQLGLASFNRKK